MVKYGASKISSESSKRAEVLANNVLQSLICPQCSHEESSEVTAGRPSALRRNATAALPTGDTQQQGSNTYHTSMPVYLPKHCFSPRPPSVATVAFSRHTVWNRVTIKGLQTVHVHELLEKGGYRCVAAKV